MVENHLKFGFNIKKEHHDHRKISKLFTILQMRKKDGLHVTFRNYQTFGLMPVIHECDIPATFKRYL